MNYELYGGEIILEFNESSHRYKVDGKFKEGVTSILGSVTSKEGLIPWAANMASKAFADDLTALLRKKSNITPDDIKTLSEDARKAHVRRKDSASDIGTEVHYAVNQFIKNGTIPQFTDKSAQKAWSAFLQWHEQMKPKYLKTEQPVYSKKLDYCGTFDCWAEINGKITMLDFKTGNPNMKFAGTKATGITSAYPKDFIQCAAYDYAHSEEFDREYSDQYMVVYITKAGKLEYFISEAIEKNIEAWECAVTLSRWYKELNRVTQ